MFNIAILLLFAIMVVMCVAMGIFLIKGAIEDGSFLLGICGVALILVAVVPFGMFGYDVYQKSNCELTSTEVTAEVTNKNHQAMWIQLMTTGKTTTSIVHPEQWNLTLESNDVVSTVSNKDYYEALKIGDKIIVIKDTWKYRNGEIYSEELKFK